MLVVQITGAWKYNYIITSEVFPASFFFHWERKSCHVSRLNFRIKIFWSYEREEKTIASDWWMLLVKITELVSHFAHNLCSFKPFLCSLIPFSQTQSSFFCLSGQRLLFSSCQIGAKTRRNSYFLPLFAMNTISGGSNALWKSRLGKGRGTTIRSLPPWNDRMRSEN